MTYHTHTTDEIVDFQQQLNDGLGERMRWRGRYIPGEAYLPNDFAYENGVEGVCNTETTDGPGLYPVGDLSDNLPAQESLANLSHVGLVASGHEYTMLKNGRLSRLEVYVPDVAPDIDYTLYIVNLSDPANPEVSAQALPPLAPDSWNTVVVTNSLVLAGQTFWVILEALNSGTNTQVTGGWTYTGTSQGAGPATQGWNRDNQHTTLRIDKTDLDSTDRTSELLGFIAGTDIQFIETADPNNYAVYRVLGAPSDEGSYVQYTVNRSEFGGGFTSNDTTTMTATIPVPSATEYSVDTDYWITNPSPDWATVTGHLELSGVEQPNDFEDLYGINVTFQELTGSDDWDRLPSSVGQSAAGNSGDSGGSGGSISNFDDIGLRRSSLLTTSGGWMDIDRFEVPSNSGLKIRCFTEGKRLDGFQYFAGEFACLVTRNGGVDIDFTRIVNHFDNPLSFRVRDQGNDVVFQVRGRNNRDYQWRLLLVISLIE